MILLQTSGNNANEATQTVSVVSDMQSEELYNSSEQALAIPPSASPSAAEESTSSCNHDKQLSNNSKVENGSDAHDLDPSAPVTISKEECSQNGISKCLETEDVSPVDDGTVDMQIVSSQVQHDLVPVTATREEHPQYGICGCDKTPNMMVEDGISDAQNVSTRAQQESAGEYDQNGVSGCNETPNTSSVDDSTSETRTVSSQAEHAMDKEESPRSSDAGGRKSQDMPMFEDGIFGGQTVSGQFHYSQGESSFSAVGPLSGRISYSGPIPYSGSVSLRSDSSTTSTRSFAFPM